MQATLDENETKKLIVANNASAQEEKKPALTQSQRPDKKRPKVKVQGIKKITVDLEASK